MRIIAGKFRHRPLIAPAGNATRPITDRAKQSLFDALQDCFATADQAVLDCFSGTGSMGLECLSRGAGRAVFVERDRRALAGLRDNIAALGIASAATILPVDAYALADSPASPLGITPFTVAFVDPPYRHTETGHDRHKVDTLLRALAARHMVDGGIISFRHPTRVSVDPSALGVLVVREFQYGDMGITWLTKA